MLQNAYLVGKIGADTAEIEQHFAENLPKIGNYPTGVRLRARADDAALLAQHAHHLLRHLSCDLKLSFLMVWVRA